MALLLMFAGLPLLLLLFTLLFRFTDADLEICRWFYGEPHDRWHCSDWLICSLLYSYGPLPGLTVGLGGLIIAVASIWKLQLRRYAQPGIFLALMLAIGPGLMVNGIFKPYWYRPRPKQVSDFGGKQDFVYVWGIAQGSHSRSFPSGHASMGFYLMGPAFLLYRRRPRWALAFIGLGVFAGSAIGAARLAQGGHFASDVLWAGGMVYATGLIVSGLFQLFLHWRRRYWHVRRSASSAEARRPRIAEPESREVESIAFGSAVHVPRELPDRKAA